MSGMTSQTLANPGQIQAPVAQQVPKELNLHGDTRLDPYFWLRDVESNPAVLDYLKAENAYTEQNMADTKALQEQLYTELKTYLVEDEQSVPRKKGDYFYYSRAQKGQSYRMYCRRKGSMTASEEVLLDLNQLAVGKDYLSMGVFKVSPDQRYLAYSIDDDGSESYTMYIKDLSTGELLNDVIPDTYYSAEWSADNQSLIYNVIDDANRPFKLFRHILGSDPKQDSLVYHEPDERFNVDLYKTNSEKYLIIEIESNSTTEQRYLPADQPGAEPLVIQPRTQNLQYNAEDFGDFWLIHNNDNARDFQVSKTPIKTPGKEFWQPLVKEREHAKLEAMQVFDKYMTVLYRTDAKMQIEAHNLLNGQHWPIQFPEDISSLWPAGEQDYQGNVLRVGYSSLVTPPTVFDYDLENKSLELKKQDPIRGYDASQYVTERQYAIANDGTKIPITLVYHRDLVKNGENPLYLYSYGSYGVSTDPDFYASVLTLLKRGFVYAIAHIRGGQEMGRQWYEDGKLLHKRNTFNDFIACAEHLIHNKYTSPKQLVIEGGSAGGLLMGAVSNLRPDLFHSVIADVPFVDAVSTMLDPSLPLTVIEYEEWGNPNHKAYYDYIKSYSPYDNVSAQNYPHMLVLAGLNDPRVKYWEPAKWVAKLRKTKTDQNLLMLKTHMNAGHSGSSGRYEALQETAFKYAFFLKTLNMPRSSSEANSTNNNE